MIFFYIQDILMTIFYTFIFVKNEMHVDFYITKGTLILHFALHLGRAWLDSVHTLCKNAASINKHNF